MSDTQRYFNLSERSPGYQLFISLVVILGAGVVLFCIAAAVGVFIFNFDATMLTNNMLAGAGKESISFIRYLLIMQDLTLFVLPGIFILNLMASPESHEKVFGSFPQLKETVLVIILAFCMFTVTSLAGKLNSGLHLPQALSGVERWMSSKEDDADMVIGMLLQSDTFQVMLFNLFMIAFLPAFGEEMIFRGIIQRILQKYFRNCHLGIWITAFIFSAIHLQFYGFLPRFILGLSFGYLYFFTGSLWLPVLAHLVNNAVPVIGEYIQKSENPGLAQIAGIPEQLLALTVSISVIIVIMIYFRNSNIKNSGSSGDK